VAKYASHLLEVDLQDNLLFDWEEVYVSFLFADAGIYRSSSSTMYLHPSDREADQSDAAVAVSSAAWK